MEPKGLIIFDMDGVLVDVTGSYRTAIKETVRHFTGTTVTDETIQDVKNEGGWNDDWLLSEHLIRLHGGMVTYDETVRYFQHVFHEGGLMRRERWIAEPGMLERLAEHNTLAVFTGRLHWEADLTLERFAPGLIRYVSGVDDVANPKPAPDGIFNLRREIPHSRVHYVGDSVDDARSGEAAGVPFIGVASPANPRYAQLKELLARKAIAVIDDINQLPQVVAAHAA